MAKKYKKIILLATVGALLVVSIAGVVSEYGNVSKNAINKYQQYISSFASGDETGWTLLDPQQQDDLTVKNDSYTLKMDLKTTRFVLTDRKTGDFYESYPQEEPTLLSEEDISRAGSNLGITYYDTNSKVNYMGTGKESVAKNQFSVYEKDNSIRVIYTLGSSVDAFFAPAAIKKETMEEIVFPKLRASEKAKMGLYYKLYSSDAKPSDYDEMMKKYPSLKGKSAYLLTDKVTEQIIGDISGLLTKANLSIEQARVEQEELGVSDAAANLPAGFVIPLQLTLDEKGFIAEILTDRIQESNKTDRLTQVFLLEYFSAVGAKTKGSFLVPDGSGALISLNQFEPKNYRQHFYNDDMLLTTSTEQQLTRNVPIPYFGLSSDQYSYVAMVEGGAAAAQLWVRTMGRANPLNMMSVCFDLRSVDKTDVGKDRNMATLNIYNGHILYEHPKVRYELISNKNPATLSDMSDAVRAWLDSKGVLTNSQTSTDVLPFYLDFLCLSSKKTNIAGIGLDLPAVLSTLTDITKVITTLQDGGVKGINLRLRGWSETGLKGEVMHSAKLSRKVGTIEELQKLRTLLESKGGTLILDMDFSFAYSNRWFDHLVLSRDASRTIEGAISIVHEYDRVTLNKTRQLRKGYIVSPLSYVELFNRFAKSLKANNIDDYKLSWSNGGMYIAADYNKKTDVDLAFSAKATSDAFSTISQFTGAPIMTDYGYDYTLPFVSELINTPLTCSYFQAETQSIPFLQMLLSGNKKMSGPALNITGSRSELLDMAAAGVAPYFLLITGQDKLLQDLSMDNTYFSLNNAAHMQNIIEIYHSYNEVLQPIWGQKIIGYNTPDEFVSVTYFENGKILWVNRSDHSQTIETINLAPYSYLLK